MSRSRANRGCLAESTARATGCPIAPCDAWNQTHAGSITSITYESEFSWFGVGTIPIRALGHEVRRPDEGVRVHRGSSRARLPAALSSIASALELDTVLDDKLRLACDDDVSRRLTDGMWRRARELAAEGKIVHPLPAQVEQLGEALRPSAIIEVLGAVVAAGFRYDPGVREDRWLARMKALVRQVKMVSADARVDVAAQAIEARGAPVVCLQFATAVSVLFYAFKRATQVLEQVFAPVIIGNALDPRSADGHVWNMLVDAGAGSIAAFDVTAHATRRAPMRELDLTRYRNISAMLGSAYWLARRGRRITGDDVGEVLLATIEPGTERGLCLLYHLADFHLTSVNTRARISAHLAACAFERVVPGWREQLAWREHQLGHLLRWGNSDDRLLPSPLDWLALRAA